MRLAIAKFVFTTVIFVFWSTLSTANDVHDTIEFPNYVDESVRHLCEDDRISLNFSNAMISKIKQDFISSPLITCLNLSDNYIENIGRGAFNKLPNLTRLFLSNNILHTDSTETGSFFDFGGHDKLEVLVMNRAISNQYYIRSIYPIISIFDEYPNLEILSLRKNGLNDLQYFPENILFSDSRYADSTPPTQKIIFPKLKILDLSENAIIGNNFMKLLSNNLYFLDLHDNQLESFDFDGTKNKLFALNLDDNRLSAIGKWINYLPALALAGLKNLHYLSISKNTIKFIESDAFQDINKLVYLNLSVNNINWLHPEIFANLQSLNTLDLSVNELESVPEMSNKIKISILYINCNNITKLISDTFMKMPKLTELLLAENQINEIDVHAFAHLSILNKLDLSRNMLSSLPEGWTESLVSLKYLDLSDNKFTLLESLSLTSTLPLIEIYLIMNPLEYLNVEYFEKLPQNLTVNLIKTSHFSIWTRAVRNSCENEF